MKVTDVEFADDVALLTDTIEEAQTLLNNLEVAAQSVGLHMNEAKTKFLCLNVPEDQQTLKSRSGKDLDAVKDFVYLGSWIANTEHDFVVRKAKAWAACHKMKNIWKSRLCRRLKIQLFQATVESILLYGSETWTMNKSLVKRVDGCYTRMLRMALNIDWKARLTNNTVYGKLPRVSTKIQERRMRLAGHVHRHADLVANKVVLWEPSHGHRGRGRPPLTFVDIIRSDTELASTMEIERIMSNRKLWRELIDTRRLYPP